MGIFARIPEIIIINPPGIIRKILLVSSELFLMRMKNSKLRKIERTLLQKIEKVTG